MLVQRSGNGRFARSMAAKVGSANLVRSCGEMMIRPRKRKGHLLRLFVDFGSLKRGDSEKSENVDPDPTLRGRPASASVRLCRLDVFCRGSREVSADEDIAGLARE